MLRCVNRLWLQRTRRVSTKCNISTRQCSTAASGVPYDQRKVETSQVTEVPSSADVVVVGGGVAGCSAIYHLASLGVRNAVLLEQSTLTAGTTWHSAGLVWRLRPSDVQVHLLAHTRQLARSVLAEESGGVDCGWIENGGLFVANTKERLNEYKRLMTLGKCFGIESHVLSPAETKELYPLMNVDDVYGTLFSPGDGTAEPAGLVAAFSRAALKKGAKIIENCAVRDIETKASALGSRQVHAVHTDMGVIRTQCVLNCAGAWAPRLGTMAGVAVPLVPMRHAYVVTEHIEGIRHCPNVRDHDLSLYLKLQGDGLSVGGYEYNPVFIDDLPDKFSFSLYDLDWDVFSSNIEGAIHRVPILAETGIKSTVCGPESFTVDHIPLMGESPEVRGFYLSCGFNSSGIMLSGGCGQQIAEWIVHGSPSLDMFSYDIRRFHPDLVQNKQWCKERSHEAYSKNYSILFPHDEPLATRNMKTDPLHEELLDAGCVYQERAGWERPGWFSLNSKLNPKVLEYDFYGAYNKKQHKNYGYKSLLEKDYTFDFPDCHSTIGLECFSCRNKAALFNMSYFGKLLLTGPDAQKAADWLFTNNMQQPGRVVYTCMLNKRGGVESDLTVSRLPSMYCDSAFSPELEKTSDPTFYVACGGAVTHYVAGHIRRVLEQKEFAAKLVDVSEKFGLLSIQGPKSRDVLQQITSTDLMDTDYSRFGIHYPLVVAGQLVWAARISFVGEFGWELHVPANSLLHIYRALMYAGQSVELCNAGYRAIDSLSLEKGYRHWHADVRSDDTPQEAGLSFTCHLDKDFLGRGAVLKQKEQGVHKRLACFTVDKNIPLHGQELLYRNGKVVGYLRRAGYAFTLQRSMGYGYVSVPNGEPVTADFVKCGKYEIESMGCRYPANAYLRSPFDVKDRRVRGDYS